MEHAREHIVESTYELTAHDKDVLAWAEKEGLVVEHESKRVRAQEFSGDVVSFNQRSPERGLYRIKNAAWDPYTHTKTQEEDALEQKRVWRLAMTPRERERDTLGSLAEVVAPRVLKVVFPQGAMSVGSVIDDQRHGADAFAVFGKKRVEGLLRFDASIASDKQVVKTESQNEERFYIEKKLEASFRRVLRGTLGSILFAEHEGKKFGALSVPGVIVPLDEPQLFGMLKAERARREGAAGGGMVDEEAIARSLVQSFVLQIETQIAIAKNAGNPKGCVRVLEQTLDTLRRAESRMSHIVPAPKNKTMQVLESILKNPSKLDAIIMRAQVAESERTNPHKEASMGDTRTVSELSAAEHLLRKFEVLRTRSEEQKVAIQSLRNAIRNFSDN